MVLAGKAGFNSRPLPEHLLLDDDSRAHGVTEFLARGVPLIAPPPELVPFFVTPLLLAKLEALSPLPPALILSIE